MVLAQMESKSLSGPECCFAEVAGNGNPFQMVCFYVILQIIIFSFLTTCGTTIQYIAVFILFECLFHH